MNFSDQIIKNKSCIEYAKKKGGQDYLNFYNETWLKIREIELNGHEFKVKNVFAFFSKIFDRVILDHYRKENKLIFVEKIVSEKTTEGTPYAKFEEWINKKPGNDFETFQRNIIELVGITDSKTDAIKMSQLSRKKFYEYYNGAKKKLLNECT